MIRHAVTALALSAAAALIPAGAAYADDDPTGTGGPAPGSPGVLSGLNIQAPINIPIVTCLTGILGLTHTQDDPDDFCLRKPSANRS